MTRGERSLVYIYIYTCIYIFDARGETIESLHVHIGRVPVPLARERERASHARVWHQRAFNYISRREVTKGTDAHGEGETVKNGP